MSQIDRTDNFLNICVHDLAPIDPSLPRLEVKLGWQGHQMTEQEVLPGLGHARYQAISAHCCLRQVAHQAVIERELVVTAGGHALRLCTWCTLAKVCLILLHTNKVSITTLHRDECYRKSKSLTLPEKLLLLGKAPTPLPAV